MTSTAERAGQLRFPGQAAAPDGPVDLAAMYLMHRGFRRDVALFADAVATVPAADRRRWRRIARRFGLFARVLHKHHHGEDVGLWPLLAERGADPAVLESLEAEHAVIDPLLASARSDLRLLADGTRDDALRARLAETTARLHDALCAHLAHEERDGMALVQQHLTQADWERLEREVFSKDYSPRDVLAVLGWVMSGLTRDQARRVPGANPLFLAVGRWTAHRFDRREARTFGSSVARMSPAPPR